MQGRIWGKECMEETQDPQEFQVVVDVQYIGPLVGIDKLLHPAFTS